MNEHDNQNAAGTSSSFSSKITAAKEAKLHGLSDEVTYEYDVVERDQNHIKIKVSLPAEPVAVKANQRIKDESKTLKLAGFREGGVPEAIARKRLGPDIIQKVISEVVDGVVKEIFEKESVKVGGRPNVDIQDFDEKKHLVFTVVVDLLPDVPEVDFSAITVPVFIISPTEEDLKKAYDEIIRNFKTYDSSAGATAQKGYVVIIDFVGSVGGKEFDGGKGDDVRLEIGSNTFIPGFEDQLIGAKAGEERQVKCTFPSQYPEASLAGKEALFNVKIKDVMAPEEVGAINDAFAQKLGLESVDALNEMVMDKLTADFRGAGYLYTKKVLFDALDAMCKVDVPNAMVEMDLEAMWPEVRHQYRQNPQMFGGVDEATLKTRYKDIAVRRVKLGIMLADLAKKFNIEVTEVDLQQLVFQEASQRPGQEKLVLDYYKNPEHLEKLRGPALEEKVVEFLLQKVNVTQKEISSKEFIDVYAQELNAMAGGANVLPNQ